MCGCPRLLFKYYGNSFVLKVGEFVNYEINDEFGYTKDYSYLYKVIDRTLEKEQAVGSVFSITFVSDEKIWELNKTYRNVDRPTDVISFAFEDNPDEFALSTRVLGDIFISIPRMQEQAVSYGHSEKRELSFLTVHGLLHLLGYDHMTKEDEQKMFSLQEEILDEERISREG